MIAANELRIGNYIRIGGNTLDTYQTFKATKVTISIIVAIAKENKERPDAVLSVWQPITLTPEILEKCGFEKKENNGLFVNNDVWLELSRSGIITPVYSDGSSFKRYIGKHVESLHQLQNLFFALTGEELEVTI